MTSAARKYVWKYSWRPERFVSIDLRVSVGGVQHVDKPVKCHIVSKLCERVDVGGVELLLANRGGGKKYVYEGGFDTEAEALADFARWASASIAHRLARYKAARDLLNTAIEQLEAAQEHH